DNDDEELEKYRITPVNLVEFESCHGRKRIFTRALLEQIVQKKWQTLEELAKPAEKMCLSPISHESPYTGDAWNIWMPQPGDKADTIGIEYLTRVELHPDHHGLAHPSPRVEKLREYNTGKMKMKDQWIPVPFVFEAYERLPCTVHENQVLMQKWHAHLKRTQELWRASHAYADVKQVFQAAAKLAVPIKRIVCFGLGKLNTRPEFYESALQHMTAFDIASILDGVYHAADPSIPDIEVFVQDPCYTQKDQVLLRTLCPRVRFVEDPYGLLAIDEHTLVIAAYLPHFFPLLQIVADMLPLGFGPAGFIIDDIYLSDSQQWYAYCNRPSPNVLRMLKDYRPWMRGFDGKLLGAELRRNVYGNRNGKRYWLEAMRVWIRPRSGK
ncbi:hypothetical protein BU26DRAFT_421735, partial [Trematosphaeria pertusa]